MEPSELKLTVGVGVRQTYLSLLLVGSCPQVRDGEMFEKSGNCWVVDLTLTLEKGERPTAVVPVSSGL